MPNIPENLADATHDVYDIGLLNAARRARERQERLAFQEQDPSQDRINTYASLRVPWWLETKYRTPWELKDFREDATRRLKEEIARNHASRADVRKDDVTRLIQHWAHRVIYNAVPLHVGYEYPDTGVAYSAEHVIKRSREELKWVARCKYMETESTEHPHWGRGKDFQLTHKKRRIVDATKGQMDAAVKLLGPEYNLQESANGPFADVLRAAVPELLSVEDRHMMRMSVDLRKQFRRTLALPDAELLEKKSDLVTTIIEIWMQINPKGDSAVAAMQEEGKPDVMQGDPGDVLRAYVQPAIDARDAAKLRALIPLLAYHTLGAISMHDQDDAEFAMHCWSELVRHVDDLPTRMIELAFLACRVAMADDAGALRAIKQHM